MAVVSMGGTGEKGGENPIFHDFLGITHDEAIPPVIGKSGVAEGSRSLKAAEIVDARASISASMVGSRAFVSGSSDLGPGTELHNKSSGRKRAISDSTFMGFPRERMLPTFSPFAESSSKLKELPGGSRGEAAFGAHFSPRVTSSSLLIHHSLPAPDRVGSKSEAMIQNAMPRDKPFFSSVPLVSLAADEGSRTGDKNCKVFNVINSSGDKTIGNPRINMPDSANSSRRSSLSTSNRQMTIFYAGQAHVFDDVPPNKMQEYMNPQADVIMALAGSDGGSWSTSFSPKSAANLAGADETVISNSPFHQEVDRRLSLQSMRIPTSGDRISRETRETNVVEAVTEARRDAL